MNCKPGELCVVVGSCEVSGDYLVGRIFKVTSCYSEKGAWYWLYEGAILNTPWGTLDALADEVLHPIRPGDVTDSEVRELFAPKQPEVA